MCVFFFKQKTAYEMRISDWSSDVCSSDLVSRSVMVRSLLCSATPTLARCQAMGTEFLFDFQEMSPVLSARRVWAHDPRRTRLVGGRYDRKCCRSSCSKCSRGTRPVVP